MGGEGAPQQCPFQRGTLPLFLAADVRSTDDVTMFAGQLLGTYMHRRKTKRQGSDAAFDDNAVATRFEKTAPFLEPTPVNHALDHQRSRAC